jgi:hypothetical protein
MVPETSDPARTPELTAVAAASWDAELAEIKKLKPRIDQTALQPPRTPDEDDRKWIVRVIIPLYAVVVLVYLSSQLYLGRCNEAADLIKTAVLPVVTLLLGYYCARPQRG